MLQLDLFNQDELDERAGHALAEIFSATPVKHPVQEGRQHPNTIENVGVELITAARFAGSPRRLVSLAQWRCPHCRAVHHYWPAKSDCQRCHAVVEFVPANQAAQTIVNWVNQ